ncbi:MAG: hypothetical protein JNK37_18025 [Verrucomicrobiales bacterium]|nr:hypothetical protein [Verrucomicrobiales bacterium]
MNLTAEQQRELATFPPELRALIRAELEAGNELVEIGHSHPAPPVGAYALLARRVSTRERASGSGLEFQERHSSLYSGEFADRHRRFFVLEAPNPPEPETPQNNASATGSAFPTGWTRLLHFRDQRPPHEVQFALECELKVLFTASPDGGPSLQTATATVNGARYDFELRYLAAIEGAHCYSLRCESFTPGADPAFVEYVRKSSDSWFQLWTRDLTEAPPPAPGEIQPGRYAACCGEWEQARLALDSIPAVQRAILDGLKRGGTFGTAHKEGGTRIYWHDGRYIRSDYGDYQDSQSYRDEAAFLGMLRQFFQFEVTRHAGSQPLPELDAWKLILRQLSPAAPGSAHHTPIAPAAAGTAIAFQSIYTTPLAIGLVIALLALTAAALAAWQLASIKSTGAPLGPAARTPTHLLQLIATTEPYLPTLHRAPGKDRYRIDLLAISLADPAQQQTFTLLRQQQSNALTPITKILGADGDTVWVQAPELFAVNLKTGRIAGEADLRKANPELGLFLNSAKPFFADHFFAVAPDWTRAYQFSADTLKAGEAPPPQRPGSMEVMRSERFENQLCAGGLVSATDWIAVATPEEAAADFKPGLSLPRDFDADLKDRRRHLYRGTVDPSGPRPRIEASERLGEREFRAGSFIRTHPGGELLLATQPVSAFLFQRPGDELFAPFTLTRLAPDGQSIWDAATGIGRLNQILPGPDSVALIGERPPVPNKVSEPILVLIDIATGTVQTVSLWR